MTNLWDQVKNKLQSVLDAETFTKWFRETAFSRIDARTLFVIVPDAETSRRIENEFSAQVASLVRDLHLEIERVQYQVQKEENSLPNEVSQSSDVYDSTSITR